MRAYLRSWWVWTGLGLLILGSGPLWWIIALGIVRVRGSRRRAESS